MVLHKYGQMLRNEFQGYNGNKFLKDMMAGLTVAAVALPLALAFGVASGADAAAGLITAIVAGIIATILSGSNNQISGPTGAMTAILITLVAEYRMQGVFIACIMAGVIMLAAGLFKLGKLIQFIPRPVVTGFTSGIAIIIALGQVDNFFGTASYGTTTISKLASYGTLGFHPNFQAVLCAMIVIFVMVVYPKKWNLKVPSSLIGIIVAGLISVIFKLEVSTVGDIPRTLIHSDRIAFASLSGDMLVSLISPAFSIAALGMIESLLCGTCASNMSKSLCNANQELIAQGISNIAMPFFGGVPSTAAIARTSVAIKSGGQTRITGIFQSVWLILCMFLLSPIMGKLPLAALSGVLMVTAWRMNEWHSIKYIFSHKMKDATSKYVVTMAATVIFDLTVAIIIGVVYSLVLMVAKMSRIDVEFSNVYNKKLLGTHEDVEKENLRTVVVYISGALFFANADTVIKRIKDLNGSYDKFILVMRGINYLDVSAAQAMMEFLNDQLEEKKEMCFTGTRDSVMRMLRRSGFVDAAGEQNFYTSVDKVLLKEERVFS